jgi:hypothetical protein
LGRIIVHIFRAPVISRAVLRGSTAIAALCLAGSAAAAPAPPTDPSGAGAFARPAAAIVDKVDGARLERIIRGLSGSDSIVVDGEKLRIKTRYALGVQIALARSWLLEQVRDAGYEPSLQRFILNIDVPDLTGSALSTGRDTLWIADASGRIYLSSAAAGWPRFSRRGDLAETIFDMTVDRLGRLWAGGRLTGSAYGGIFLSTDAGATWTLKGSGTDIYTIGTIVFSTPQLGMAAGSNGTVVRTGDGGETWGTLTPATFGYESINDAAVSGPLHYWLVTDVGSVYETSDFGARWTRRSFLFGVLRGVDFSDERHGIIVGGQNAYYTKDRGVTWTRVAVPTELTCVKMGDSLRAVAGGTNGQIWASGDGGATWERFGSECASAADVWSIVSPDSISYWLSGRDIVRTLTWDAAGRGCAEYLFADTVWAQNIRFRHEGSVDPSHRLLLTAHYDSYSGSTPLVCAPGADDNGTGTVAVLECARALRDERTERTVEFVLFDGEELGLKGSRYFASVLDTGVVYDGVLNIDMIGWEPNAANTAVVSERIKGTADTLFANAIVSAIDSFGLDLSVSVLQGEPLTSDHAAFWEVGIPGVLLIEGTRAELTPYYHSCSDIAEHLNEEYFEVCTKTALGAIALMAGLLPPETAPKRLALHQNYPNPFNAGTTVPFALPRGGEVEIAVYDLSGRRVALIERGRRGAGEFERPWNGTDDGGKPLASGVYFLRLRAGGLEAVRKIVILR